MRSLQQHLLLLMSILSLDQVTTAQMAPGNFYPFDSVAGSIAVEDENSTYVGLSRHFVFFGRMYHQLYVNNNGHLSFIHPSTDFIPDPPPSYSGEDIIAPLWTDIDVSPNGFISYKEYIEGDLLANATQDINLYFPDLSFTATWVFVATWHRVAYFLHPGTESSFQVVLISDGYLSFVLMNYEDIALTPDLVLAGYDTVNSARYFVIPDSRDGNTIPNLKNSSNVNVPGRWVFRVDSEQETVVGLQIRVTSYSDLTEIGNIPFILEKLKQELVDRGFPSSLELNLRRVEKATP
ncbi:sushi, nidogen and EGF-like domain-containing protein 1 [Triplophysa dalaica]|uniref:sushi, nidogen and EGF-like domain-containing protein 1 n=1 Tax=Triplophysa dalaica TaxID=1582913 RepID=UPI0024DFB88D|nr:sushi, nidogen and EGF-like domain-containing protein 1 [Triplophysa dalaica]